MKKRLIALGLLGMIGSVKSQSLVSGNGGTYQDSQLQISWTLGEMRTESFSSINLTIIEGQQQNSSPITTSLNDLSELLSVKIYPNPTKGLVQLENKTNQTVSFTLAGSDGRTMDKGDLKTSQTLSLVDYPDGIYVIKIQDNSSQLIKTYKIIKN